MKRPLLLGAALIAWLGLVFLLTLRLTFPSEAVADRLAWEVQRTSGGRYELQLRDLVPWRLGASAEAIRVLKHDRRAADGEPTLAFAAEEARVEVGFWSLVRRSPRLTGTVRIGSGDVDFVVATTTGKGGAVLEELQLDAPRLPLADVAVLAGADLEGTGALELEVRMLAPEGLARSDGEATIRGGDLLITKLDLSSMGVPDLGMEIPIEDVDIALDLKGGKATVTRGTLRSALATVRLQGAVTLRDDVGASQLDLELIVGDLGEALQPFQGFLGTPWRDGDFHFRCTGTFDRSNCRAEREPGPRGDISRPIRPGREGLTPDSRATTRPPVDRATTERATTDRPAGSPRGDATMTDEERERRREELRERLRKRRQEMRAQRAGAGDDDEADPPDDELDDDEFDEYLDDDEVTDEELLEEEF